MIFVISWRDLPPPLPLPLHTQVWTGTDDVDVAYGVDPSRNTMFKLNIYIGTSLIKLHVSGIIMNNYVLQF
jgi:predicted secreted protein